MVGYRVTRSKIENAIDQLAPATARRESWLNRAIAHRETMRTAGHFIKGPAWSDIKEAFIDIQNSKCAYCEKELEGEDFGLIEQDVEHYRPKNAVRSWALASEMPFPVYDGAANGYYMLAHNPSNYCTSCKVCNSTLKSNCFPIEGQAGTGAETEIRALNRTEKPFLPNPVGTLDEPPEDFLTFEGVSPVPVTSRGRRWRRAKVTIRFFRLDVRETLLKQRYRIVRDLYKALKWMASDDPLDREEGEADVERMTQKGAPHSSFAKSYYNLFIEDVDAALDLFRAARIYLRTPDRE